MKTHWKQLVNPDYIGAYSLPSGKDMNITIEKVVRELVTGMAGKKEECTVAHLKGNKPFILNKTNCKSITKIANTPYIEDWAGLTITIYAAVTKLKGEDVECLRIREKAPEKEDLTPKHQKWVGALKAIKDGSVTIEQIKANYKVSKESEVLLCSK